MGKYEAVLLIRPCVFLCLIKHADLCRLLSVTLASNEAIPVDNRRTGGQTQKGASVNMFPKTTSGGPRTKIVPGCLCQKLHADMQKLNSNLAGNVSGVSYA